MTQPQDLERRSAQALLATYMQMARHGQLAQQLQKARQRSVEERIQKAVDPREVQRLERQLEAQQRQAAALEGALGRMKRPSEELASFAEAGLSYEDFESLGLSNVVSPADVESARERGNLRRSAQQSSSTGDPEPQDG